MTPGTLRAVRIKLARWDPEAVRLLEHEGISVFDSPKTPLIHEPVDVTLELVASDERDARLRVGSALRGWATIVPHDFLAVAPI